jgi:hypothetical protein
LGIFSSVFNTTRTFIRLYSNNWLLHFSLARLRKLKKTVLFLTVSLEPKICTLFTIGVIDEGKRQMERQKEEQGEERENMRSGAK